MTKLFRLSFLVIFLMVLLIDVFQWQSIYFFVKPLIMISLIGLYWSAAQPGERSVTALAAFFFSWGGDVFLLFTGDLFFMLGLASFLVSHIFYIVSYRQHRLDEGVGFYGVQKARYSFPIILAGTGLLTVLYPVLGDMKIPVTAYALVLVVMVLSALFRFGFTSKSSFLMVLTGAILFMVSDSALAINKFLTPLKGAGLLIMSTYMAAQYLIVEGLVKHKAT